MRETIMHEIMNAKKSRMTKLNSGLSVELCGSLRFSITGHKNIQNKVDLSCTVSRENTHLCRSGVGKSPKPHHTLDPVFVHEARSTKRRFDFAASVHPMRQQMKLGSNVK